MHFHGSCGNMSALGQQCFTSNYMTGGALDLDSAYMAEVLQQHGKEGQCLSQRHLALGLIAER